MRRNVLDFKGYINVYEDGKFIRKECSKQDRLEIIERCNKIPGTMNLNEKIFIARKEAEKFEKTELYTDIAPKTKDWINYWEKQKELCYTGILIDDFYITGDLYWYLNFIKIPNKVVNDFTFPDIYDMDIWFFQLLEKSELTDKYTITLKKRQSGFSLKMLAKILKRWWFEYGFVGRIGAYGDKPLNDDWDIIISYYNHLHTHTAWKRNKTGKRFAWTQETIMNDGTTKGRLSKLQAMTCSKDPSKVVGGKVDEVLLEEAGIFPNLNKVIGFAEAALFYGDKKTGNLNAFGAVGELKDAGPMKDFFYSPKENKFLSIKNTFSENGNQSTGAEDEDIGIFIPEYFSYYSEVSPCMDIYGNTLIENAIKKIKEKYREEENKSLEDFILYKSQHPLTPEEAFAERSVNDFPIHIIQPWYNKLEKLYDPIIVTLKENSSGSVFHSLGSDYPIVKEFPVKRKTQKHGSVVIDEFPLQNAPYGLYYAGVDTISPVMTEVSKSLQVCYIYKAAHELDNEFAEDKIVAWYAGRPNDNRYGAFEITKKLIKFYNAKSAIESDNKNFIEWMIKERQTKRIMKRAEFPLHKDILTTSNISKSEYGLRVGGSHMKNYLTSLCIEYIEEIIGYRFDEKTSESIPIYGVERIKDIMLLKEMLNYTPKKNVDRISAFGLVLFAAKSHTNRGIKIRSKKEVTQFKRISTPFKRIIRSPFK